MRLIASVLLLIASGTACAFADIIDVPRVRTVPMVITYISVIVIIVVLALLRRAVRKRRLKNDGTDPESDIEKIGRE